MCKTCLERGKNHRSLDACIASLLVRLNDSEEAQRALAVRLQRATNAKRKLAMLAGEQHVEERVAVLEAKVSALEDR